MMEIILDEYTQTGGQPEGILALMMAELDFLYKRNTTLFGYLNTASELTFEFVLGEAPTVAIADLREVNFTRLPDTEVLRLMETALLVTRDHERLSPGPLTLKLKDLRMQEFRVRSPEFQAAMSQAIGVIAVALTKALFDLYGVEEGRGGRFPRSAMAVLHLLAALVIEADANHRPIDSRLPYDRFLSITQKMLTARQQRFAVYLFVSILDGRARLIKDYDPTEHTLVLDDVVVKFLERIRELIRERERERAGRV